MVGTRYLLYSLSIDSNRYHVLDVLSNRKMLAMILNRKGLPCDQAADGGEVLSQIEDKGLDYYDIIFMDSIMPVMSGPEAATKLRALGFSKLIIGVTGNAMDCDIKDYEDAGADMILTKPVRVDMLDKVLSYCRTNGSISHYNFHLTPITSIKIKNKSLKRNHETFDDNEEMIPSLSEVSN